MTFLAYLVLFAGGFVALAATHWLATMAATEWVARAGRRYGWAERPEHELGVAYLAPLVVFAAFLLAFLIVCLNRDHSFGTVFLETFGAFALAAVVAVGWSKRSAFVWVAQMLVPGFVFAILAWLLTGD